jgi:Holliday junction resolvase
MVISKKTSLSKKKSKSQIGKASKRKGATGEREFARYLTEKHGIEASRGVQYQGSPDSPDIIVPSLPKLHFEVKRTETLSLYAAMEQAINDAGDKKIPIVAHRRSHKDWLIVLHAKDMDEFAFQLLHRSAKDD